MYIPESVFAVSSCDYKHIPQNTRIFRKDEVSAFLDVYIPELADSCTNLVEINQITPTNHEVDIPLFVKQQIENNIRKPWIDINNAGLDLEVGLHIYQIKLMDVTNNVVSNKCFGYRILNADRCKDYIYMR